MKKYWILILAFLQTLFLIAPVFADVVLNNIYTDNMVLQRDQPIIVKGTADQGERVAVTLNDLSTTVPASRDGGWRAVLPKCAAGGPYTLTVRGTTATIELKNVLVGDVWLCGGQSNMDLDINYYRKTYPDLYTTDTFNIANPDIRYFRVEYKATTEPLTNVVPWSKAKTWRECNEDTNREFAATGYYFGTALQPQIGVPVGLIHCAVSGTLLRLWVPRETMRASEVLKGYLRRDDVSIYPFARPNMSYNGMIAPLTDFPIKGVIWYQGEQDAAEKSSYYQDTYGDLFVAMIQAWRAKWRQPDMPFIYVLLAGYTNKDYKEPEIRAAQIKTLDRLPNVAAVSATDLGLEGPIHPPFKKQLGDRMCSAALHMVYGQSDLVAAGPRVKSITTKPNKKIEVTFKDVGGGLEARTMKLDKHELKAERLEGFEVCGRDGKYYAAEASITGKNAVTLICPAKVAAPAAVRFAWSNFPVCNLYNKEGFPALPFRKNVK